MIKNNKPLYAYINQFRPLIIIITVYLIYLIGESIFFLIAALIKRFIDVPDYSSASIFSFTGLMFRILLLVSFIIAVFIGEKLIFKETLLPTPYKKQVSTGQDILLGLVLGAFLFALLFLAFWALDWLTITGSIIRDAPVEFTKILWSIPAFLLIAVFEELFARGFLLSLLKKYYGKTAGITLSALLFSLMHLHNPNVNPWGLIGILGAGVWLGMAYESTSSLYFPTALHLSWNLFQSLLGFPVSGLDTPNLIAIKISGPALWTGGEFGPEAGIAGYFLIFLGIIVVIWYKNAKKSAGNHLKK